MSSVRRGFVCDFCGDFTRLFLRLVMAFWDWFSARQRALRQARHLVERDRGLPEAVRHYVQAQEAYDPDTPLSEVKWTIFDTETTGLDIAKDRLLMIGGLQSFRGSLRAEHSAEWLIRQTHTGGHEAVSVHQLLKTDVENGLDEAAVLLAFLEWVGGTVLVGHSVAFDIQIVSHHLARHWGIPLLNQAVDTRALAMRTDSVQGPPYPPEYNLDALAKKHGLQVEHLHHAASDAFVTAQLFEVLLAKGQRRNGWKTLEDVIG